MPLRVVTKFGKCFPCPCFHYKFFCRCRIGICCDPLACEKYVGIGSITAFMKDIFLGNANVLFLRLRKYNFILTHDSMTFFSFGTESSKSSYAPGNTDFS